MFTLLSILIIWGLASIVHVLKRGGMDRADDWATFGVVMLVSLTFTSLIAACLTFLP